MNESSESSYQVTRSGDENPSNFQAIFCSGDRAVPVKVPDYQRAYSWDEKQIDLFIRDLSKYQGVGKGYYFGHFIAEDLGKHWEIVDGQQRLTTFVLFLMVCQLRSPIGAHEFAYSMIEHFSTVSYDCEALGTIGRNLGSFLGADRKNEERKPPSDEEIVEGLSLKGSFTRSQRRMVLALIRFHQAFEKGKLRQEKIGDYISAVMTAHCSHHLAPDKAVAVNIFEMHNTRGVPLTTLEIVKAMLMKFVYDHGGADRELKVAQIQTAFGEIYGMEERLAARSFRGEMTMEQLLRLHLRVVDDGTKVSATDFQSPPANANAEALVEYVDSRLRFKNGDKIKLEKPKDAGVKYALRLAEEFRVSVGIVSETLPAWDKQDELVGDVLILDRDLSCQFFLIICRRLKGEQDKADGRIGKESLRLWEKLLFTRDFHGGYHNLKGGRDDFPTMFASCGPDEAGITAVVKRYLEDGFRPDRTKGLQAMVAAYLNEHKPSVLNGAFHWWKSKMIYAIYKYEISLSANIRDVMKGTISVEHILPQEWQWKWVKGSSGVLGELSDEEKAHWLKAVDAVINGIGNLLLITPGENSSVSNAHPADKRYERYCAGSYAEHNLNREKWRHAEEWSGLIHERGERIFKFMLSNLVDASECPRISATD
ncbi:MAG: DUF262 domain-containing HNH endonuclease family protein [Prosthecobacter sp.]|uniref:DUF262 domain-containing protein n=1 Tax=Prosthecobacter sp. TaxID=1965333 RepID=UPI0025DC3D20|nr:DUF262 domain-containing HNH endonuclease family protein [Prosthecobacter sp.]MCF7787148.1 DUF262 domain-containing HNH endonuclease family protein [Prosthecobacter sp.]